MVSSLAAEALAMVASIGELVYMTAVLTQIYGNQVNDIPRVVVTDAKNLEEAVKSTSLVEDPWLIPMSPLLRRLWRTRLSLLFAASRVRRCWQTASQRWELHRWGWWRLWGLGSTRSQGGGRAHAVWTLAQCQCQNVRSWYFYVILTHLILPISYL